MELEKNPKTRKVYRRLLTIFDKARGLPFPKMKRTRQISVSHCGPAVLEALFSYAGLKVSQTAIVKSLRAQNKITREGLSIKDLARAASAVGGGDFGFWEKSGARTTDLDRVVNKYKYPAGVEWQGVFHEFEDEDNGHYGVVTAIDRKARTLRISDPFHEFAGVDRKFDIKFFVKRWWDINVIKGRKLKDEKMMFVITPKGEIWPKKVGMKRTQ